MGQIRFLVPRRKQISEGALERAYLAGMEGIPWRSHNSWSASASHSDFIELVLQREVSDSGNLYVPWCVSGRGELVLSTGSLMERAKPYHLQLELARGTVNRVRNQLAEWQYMGLHVPPDLEEDLRRMSDAFSQAATAESNDESVSQLAEHTIELALDVIDKLTATYSAQAITARRASTPTLPTFFAGRLDSRSLTEQESASFGAAFNSAMIAFRWQEIEESAGKLYFAHFDEQIQWCEQRGLRIVAGPLLQLDEHNTPSWLKQSEGNFDRILTTVVQYVRAIVERYRGRVHVWNCAARMNLDCAVRLNEEERLRLVVAIIDEVQRLDPRTPYIISFDQPWAEYLAVADHDFSPLHFADSLVRAELGLAGIALEMNFGYWPFGTLPRDWLEVSRQLDRWNMLGLPLLVATAIPSDYSDDPNARVQLRTIQCEEQQLVTAESQREAAQRIGLLALAKSFVHGFIWNEISDAVPHEFAHAGLFDAENRSKPALETLTSLRQQYLT